MKKYIAAAFVFSMLLGPAAARADDVVNERDGNYNPGGFTATIVNGATGSADTINFDATAFNFAFAIDLTNANGVVLDTIFSPGPAPDGLQLLPGDAFQFAGINSGNAAIGTTCVDSSTVACVVRTGGVQDLTSEFAALDGGHGLLLGGDLIVQADDTPVAPVPEPSSLTLLATGIAGAFGVARRRFIRAV